MSSKRWVVCYDSITSGRLHFLPRLLVICASCTLQKFYLQFGWQPMLGLPYMETQKPCCQKECLFLSKSWDEKLQMLLSEAEKFREGMDATCAINSFPTVTAQIIDYTDMFNQTTGLTRNVSLSSTCLPRMTIAAVRDLFKEERMRRVHQSFLLSYPVIFSKSFLE